MSVQRLALKRDSVSTVFRCKFLCHNVKALIVADSDIANNYCIFGNFSQIAPSDSNYFKDFNHSHSMFPSVTEMDFRSDRKSSVLTTEFFEAMMSFLFGNSPNLTSLLLGDSLQPDEFSIMMQIIKANNIKLTKLTMCNNNEQISDDLLEYFQLYSQLEFVDLCGSRGIKHIAYSSMLTHCQKLTHLDISYAKRMELKTMLIILKKGISLISLIMQRTELIDFESTDNYLENIQVNCSKLTYFDASNCFQLPSSILLSIAKKCLQLQHINVNNAGDSVNSAVLNAIADN